VTLVFSKRPTFVAATTFGSYTGDECCAGYPAISDWAFQVPTPTQDGGTGNDGAAL
jgi:hypothetical protein